MHSSCTARYPWSIAASVYAYAAASELAMVIRPNGWRARTQGSSSGARGPTGIVLIGIPMWPPVDGDGDDIAPWIETCWCQHATEFIADVSLECGKGVVSSSRRPSLCCSRAGRPGWQGVRTSRSSTGASGVRAYR